MSGSRPPSSTRRPFGATLRAESTVVDVALILSVPVIMLAIMTIPRSVRASFAFEYVSPSPVTAFASSFVHLSPLHLVWNLVAYTVVVSVTYLLAISSGQRRQFRVVFVSLVIATPVLVPYLNLTIVRQSATVGFSGVLMALYGYLPVSLGTYLQQQFDLGADRTTAPLLFFVGLSVMTVLTLIAVVLNPVVVPVRGVSVPVTSVLAGTLVSLTGALVLVVILYLTSVPEHSHEIRGKLRRAVRRPGYAELAIVAGGVFLAIPFATFPINPVTEAGVLNLYSHLVGYGLGFTATYTWLAVERWLFDETTAR